MARTSDGPAGQRVVEPTGTQVARAVKAVPDDVGDAPTTPPEKGTSLGERVQRLLAWWQQTRVGRGLARYGVANGALLAGGIAYAALFSIFAALVIAFAVFSLVLGSDPGLQDTVFEAVNEALPGIIETGGNEGLVTPAELQARLQGGPGVAGVLTTIMAVVVLLNSATSVIAAIRSGIRAMFGVVVPNESPVTAKLRDVAAFGVLALAVVATAVLGTAVGAAGSAITSLVGLDDNPVPAAALRVVGIVVTLAIDTAVVMFLVRRLGAVRAPHRDLLIGAVVTAVGAGAIRLAGTALVGSVSNNAVLAGFAAIGTLLLWVNLVVRVLLMVAAWTANPPAPPTVGPDQVTHAEQTPNFVTETDPDTLAWDHDPQTGRIRPEDKPEPEPEEYWGGAIGWARRKYRGFRDA